MKNIVDVIKQKERDIQQMHREIQQMETDIQTLQAAARLLADEGETVPAPVIARTQPAKTGNGEVKQFP